MDRYKLITEEIVGQLDPGSLHPPGRIHGEKARKVFNALWEGGIPPERVDDAQLVLAVVDSLVKVVDLGVAPGRIRAWKDVAQTAIVGAVHEEDQEIDRALDAAIPATLDPRPAPAASGSTTAAVVERPKPRTRAVMPRVEQALETMGFRRVTMEVRASPHRILELAESWSRGDEAKKVEAEKALNVVGFRRVT